MKKQPKWLKYDDVQLVSLMIRTNLKNRDFTKLESAVNAGFDKFTKSKYYDRLLIDGTLALVSYFLGKNQHYKSLQLLEKARQIFPNNRKIVRNEVQLLESIFNLYYSDFVVRDLSLLDNISRLLLLRYHKGFPKEKLLLENLVNSLTSLEDNVKEGVESKNTFYLEGFLLNLYGDLSKDQQIEEFTKIITPEILKWIAENVENESEDEGESESYEQED